MKAIFDEYGDVILQVLGGLAVVGMLVGFLLPNGELHELIVSILDSVA